eukprot:CAMPEP_0181041672 /NCGR_PEP_ID=MMETSP1070-20121207/11723_1 /TAXON_ID=265543 /ORGANISM="Minutocellus polymorphus, Strain NH13" /LENGTH=397 /DNA_ID=CAMNT_0023119797 /DNA_START=8 /DNA_END=1201 /DNA_ORIENTATION=-
MVPLFPSLPLAARSRVLFPFIVLVLAHDVLAFVPPPASHLLDATLSDSATIISNFPGRGSGRQRSKQILDTIPSEIGKLGARTNRRSALASSDDDQSSDSIQAAQAKLAVTGVTLKLAFDSSPNCWGIADLSATKSERFTSPQSLDMVHRLRAGSDCVLVGKGTVVADDCTLTVRRGYETTVLEATGRDQPTRVVLDSHLELVRDHVNKSCSTSYKLLEDGLPVIIYHLGTTNDVGEDIEAFLRNRPAITLVDASKLLEPKPESDSDETVLIQGGSLLTVSVPAKPSVQSIAPLLVVQDLHTRGIHHIMVEGGAATALSFLRAGVVDRAIIVKASVQFQEPLDSNIDEGVLTKEGGLQMLGTSDDGDSDKFGGDCLQYWVRGDGDEGWPAEVLADWP